MARQPGLAGSDPLADLAKKIAVLEEEMAIQRAAMERLDALAASPRDRLPPEKTHRPRVSFNGV